MAEEPAATPVVETPVVETPVKEVAAAEEKTLLGEAVTPESKAEADKVAAEEKVKADALKNETPEQKTARETKEAEDLKANTVPEKYEIKAPEGMAIDPQAVEVMSPLFKELKLTSVQAQKLVDTYAPIVKAQADAQQKAAIDVWNKETEGWKTESLKALGADAPKELAFAAKIINKIGTKYEVKDAQGNKASEGNKLRDVLEETRVGNHPEITKLFIQLGKLISEDSFVDGSKQITDGKADLYDHPDSKANLK